MLEVARRRVPRSVRVKLAPAEELPFRDGWFERVTMTLVYHHLDRPRALAESRRVLATSGRLAVLTFDPSQIERYYLSALFPSLRSIDLERFRPADELATELRAAGFGRVRFVRHDQRVALSRADALERIRARHISTFQLIPEEEYAAGLERAERELPERIEYENRWLVVVAAA
jgi:SAM-dependent methyltransferase